MGTHGYGLLVHQQQKHLITAVHNTDNWKNKPKKKGIKRSPWFCVTLTEVKPPLSRAIKVLEPSQDKPLYRLCLCLAKRQIKPSLGPLVQNETIPAASLTLALRFSTCQSH